jgi:hypothetical protein
MEDSCPSYLDVPSHRLRAYPPEFDLLALFGHLSVSDRLNYVSSEFQGKRAVAPRSKQQTRALDQK